ncbi:MAG: AAA family ATPase, partial [Bacteroidales bacterium]|nr:AAA family ATPase [Bacteroidales bacterium]
MERIVFQKLIEWKNSANRKPLILNGARQVGKTWLLGQLGDKHYDKVAYLVCRKNQALKDVFSQDFNTDRILRALRALSGVDITPGDTLIVLDEVQDIPEAIESLKYFCEDAPEYHIAVAGSLLGISLHKDVSYPVGKVDEINVYPLNFAEFLLAKGETEAYKLLKEKDFSTTNLIHKKYVDLLRQYYYVGGMPAAVKVFIETDGLQAVRKVQKSILNGYERD